VLGRSLGLTEEQLSHLTDDVPPAGVYTPAEAAIVRYAQKSTRLEPIDDALYADLADHFSPQQLIDICLTVGLSNMVNRFHATFGTDLDAQTVSAAEAGDAVHGACPLPRPKPPA
jgi:alkylhydroperoxidase family enzyme